MLNNKFFRTFEGKLVLALGAIIVIVLGYYVYATKINGGDEPAPVVEVAQTDHVRGTPGAKVTLIEFGDFQCPACAAYEPLVEKVIQDNKKDVQLVFRQFPLMQIHQNALLAAKASEAAGVQGKFWEMHDMLYQKQQEWSGSMTAKTFMVTYAKSLNLDTKKFEADLDSKAIEDKIKAEYAEGVRLKVPGTPTFFLNGKMIDNPRSPEEFTKLIQDAAK